MESVELIDGVEVSQDGKTVVFKGKKGESRELINDPVLKVEIADKKITLTSSSQSRNEKRKIKTHKAHLLNKIHGVSEGYIYKLKICSGHFPMNVGVANDKFTIKNFLGEKVPRELKIKEGVTVKVEGEIVTVESVDKDRAGQVAADIEQLCRVTNRDLRVFQDGIYLIEKAGAIIK